MGEFHGSDLPASSGKDVLLRTVMQWFVLLCNVKCCLYCYVLLYLTYVLFVVLCNVMLCNVMLRFVK